MIKSIILKCFKILKYFIFIIVPILIIFIYTYLTEISDEKLDNLNYIEDNNKTIKFYKNYFNLYWKIIFYKLFSWSFILKNFYYKEWNEITLFQFFAFDQLTSLIDNYFDFPLILYLDPVYIIKRLFGLDFLSIFNKDNTSVNENYYNIKYFINFFVFYIIYFLFFK